MFSHHRLSVLAATAIGAAAVGLAALAGPATAGASTVDDTFIGQITAEGITFDSPQSAINDGHNVCQELADGKNGVDIQKEILGQTDLTDQQAASFVVYAAQDYCPQYVH